MFTEIYKKAEEEENVWKKKKVKTIASSFSPNKFFVSSNNATGIPVYKLPKGGRKSPFRKIKTPGVGNSLSSSRSQPKIIKANSYALLTQCR